MRRKILLLGSGELGKELVIALQRLGQYIIAVDSYSGAPAMQVAHESEVINMLNATSLDAIVAKHQPNIIVPEIEAIRTEQFFAYEKQGIQVVPSAKAANFTMNRKLIRDLASKELGLRTAKYLYATEFEQFKSAVLEIGIPCIVKPLMSSSGKGQSVIKTAADMEHSWNYALEGSRGDVKEVIIEEFINFQSEITLLTVTQKNGDTLFCAPIGHRQERGDYQESWQPAEVKESDLKDAQEMAAKVTKALGGAGIWGVEFFLAANGVYFSELSPRPHDTGMVTLAQTQNLNEFELHARAILGLPIPQIELLNFGVSAVILANQSAENYPVFSGVEDALSEAKCDIRLFGKPTTRKHRRMGVSLVYDKIGSDMKQLREKAFRLASKVAVN
jgi:phosphoribosylglycinamide formyltransferase 2